MAVPTAFIAGGSTPNGDSALANFVEFDATVSVATDFSGDISTHPIETGARIADHFTRENPKFSIQGVTSNHPVTPTSPDNAVIAQGNRAQSMYDVLVRMYLDGAIFTLVTNLDTYPGCILRSLGNTQEVDSAESVRVDLEVEQIRIVSSRLISTPSIFRDLDGEGGTQNGGSQSGEAVSEEESTSSFQSRTGEVLGIQ